MSGSYELLIMGERIKREKKKMDGKVPLNPYALYYVYTNIIIYVCVKPASFSSIGVFLYIHLMREFFNNSS